MSKEADGMEVLVWWVGMYELDQIYPPNQGCMPSGKERFRFLAILCDLFVMVK